MWLARNKISVIWLVLVTSVMGVFLFPHGSTPLVTIITNLLFVTLFVLSLFIVIREKNWNNKAIFLNFTVFGAYFLISGLYPLTGISLFTTSEYSRHFHYQYGTIYYHIFLLFAVVYLVIDMLFRQRRISIKYGLTVVIVAFISISYYGDFFENPKYLYDNPDINDFVAIDQANYSLIQENGEKPTVEEIASIVQLNAWKKGKAIGELYHTEKVNRVDEMIPFLEGQNYLVLLMRPLNKANVLINTFAILFIFLFFAYQYKKDPPQGAYVEKIMFLLLIFVSLDTFHSWAYVKSVQWQVFMEFLVIGQYLTMMVLSLLTIFFGLRLRFISTVQGEFYEQQLVSNPERITRWRDWVDNFVLSYIFNSQTLVGRLLAPGKARR
jgi:hypothetical protein